MHASILKIQLFKILRKGGGGMCSLPPAHMSLIRKDSWTLTFFIFIQFLHLLFLWLRDGPFDYYLQLKHWLIWYACISSQNDQIWQWFRVQRFWKIFRQSDPTQYLNTHHFFRNACTKSGSLRFSQFSGCWRFCLFI